MSNYALGMILGIIVGLLVTALVMKFFNKDHQVKTQYDERQQRVRGDAYKYGFYAVAAVNVIFMILYISDVDLKALGLSMFFLPIVAGIIVQVTYSIFHDGYVGLNSNMKRYILIMTVVSVVNLGVGVLAGTHGEMMKQGVLQGAFINLLCGGLFVVIAAELLIKKFLENRDEA